MRQLLKLYLRKNEVCRLIHHNEETLLKKFLKKLPNVIAGGGKVYNDKVKFYLFIEMINGICLKEKQKKKKLLKKLLFEKLKKKLVLLD